MSIDSPAFQATCYRPDGTAVDDWYPCEPIDGDGNGATFCCALANSVCTSRGYCLGSAGVFYRGGCTDQSWQSGHCPYLCSTKFKNSFANIFPCQAGVVSDQKWSCDFCDSNDEFTFDPGVPYMPQVKYATFISNTTTTTSFAPTMTSMITTTFTSQVTTFATVTTAPIPVDISRTPQVKGLASGFAISALLVVIFFALWLRTRSTSARADSTAEHGRIEIAPQRNATLPTNSYYR